MNDPIVDEVRRVRDAHAARFNYDLDAIFQDIKEQEIKSGLHFVDGAARFTRPNDSQQSTALAVPGPEGSRFPQAGPTVER
jgi:hypothetical protein